MRIGEPGGTFFQKKKKSEKRKQFWKIANGGGWVRAELDEGSVMQLQWKGGLLGALLTGECYKTKRCGKKSPRTTLFSVR